MWAGRVQGETSLASNPTNPPEAKGQGRPGQETKAMCGVYLQKSQILEGALLLHRPFFLQKVLEFREEAWK